MIKKRSKKVLEKDSWDLRLCKSITTLRLKQGRSLVDVSACANLSPSYYSKIERGLTGNMHMATLIGIRRSLEAKWVDLFGTRDSIITLLQLYDNDNNEE